jgi:hypothetical protein
MELIADDDVQMEVELETLDWIQVYHNRDKLQALVNTAMNLLIV